MGRFNNFRRQKSYDWTNGRATKTAYIKIECYEVHSVFKKVAELLECYSKDAVTFAFSFQR